MSDDRIRQLTEEIFDALDVDPRSYTWGQHAQVLEKLLEVKLLFGKRGGSADANTAMIYVKKIIPGSKGITDQLERAKWYAYGMKIMGGR